MDQPRRHGKTQQLILKKRSVTLAGHRTSVTLEPAFWAALEAIAKQRGASLQKMIEDIDIARGSTNLSSALRVYVLDSVIKHNNNT